MSTPFRVVPMTMTMKIATTMVSADPNKVSNLPQGMSFPACPCPPPRSAGKTASTARWWYRVGHEEKEQLAVETAGEVGDQAVFQNVRNRRMDHEGARNIDCLLYTSPSP